MATETKSELDQLLEASFHSDVAITKLLQMMVPHSTEKIQETVFKYFEKHLETKNPIAQYMIGHMYYHGHHVKRNYAEALKYFTLSADQGNSSAEMNIGVMYMYGQGVVKDERVAVKYIKNSAEKGNIDAINNMATFYVKGWGDIKVDYDKAMNYYKLADEKGDWNAPYWIGIMHARGYGVPVNHHHAVENYKRSAERKHTVSQTLLGIIYENGQDVPRDVEQAIKYYKMAVGNDDGKTITLLTKLYMKENRREDAEKLVATLPDNLLLKWQLNNIIKGIRYPVFAIF
ncbi:MAG: hypothetical protein Edafosvirus1_14 [Edafosvirus sp.]|uniref:Sel1 repeat family protein n=1 Tax=Edafosvirus sp. TaxID=2487765 RepID=A0A3G4ZVN6_9VIRU|nr:MAG: hypothetical protein Edafosvirus1_14 [Edafosvirus sp.]